MGSANKYRFFKKHLGCGIETLFIRRENETRSGSGNMGRHERRAELSEFKRKVSRAGVVTYLVDAAGRVTGHPSTDSQGTTTIYDADRAGSVTKQQRSTGQHR